MPFYSRKHVRVPWHDYGAGGWYFLTICTHERQNLFGEIVGGKAVLSQIGQIVESCWEKSFEMRPDLRFGEFVVMPNHLHALFGIDDAQSQQLSTYVSNLVKGFKAACSREARILEPCTRLWQRNYHEHIVKDRTQWDTIANYIFLNPTTWEQDRFYRK